MAKRADTRLKLPNDFLGTVRALLQTPPPPKGWKSTRPKARKRGTKRARKEAK